MIQLTDNTWQSDNGLITFIKGDCMQFMAGCKENEFELAVVDPEFGINIGKSARLVTDKGLKAKEWDNKPIDLKYFDTLFNASNNQIIWGGNYYALPANKHCIIWDKLQPEKLSFGMFDYAWTSFDGSNKMFRQSIQKEIVDWHPTSKPIALYRWIFKNYAKPTDHILDTHGGSMSSAIAAHMEGLRMTIIELDPEYFHKAITRFATYEAQQTIKFD